jgi:hypothetical protein
LDRERPQNAMKRPALHFLSGTCRGKGRSGVSLPRPHLAAESKENATMSSPFVWFHNNGKKPDETPVYPG